MPATTERVEQGPWELGLPRESAFASIIFALSGSTAARLRIFAVGHFHTQSATGNKSIAWRNTGSTFV
jgi:hypothetical protein